MYKRLHLLAYLLVSTFILFSACSKSDYQVEFSPDEPNTKAEIYTEAVAYMQNTEYWDEIVEGSCWSAFTSNFEGVVDVPSDAELITTLDQLMNLSEGTESQSNIYHVKGDFILPTKYDDDSTSDSPKSMGIKIPSYTTIYFEGSIYKEGLFLGDTDPNDGIEEENRWDVIFDLSKSVNVNMYGINSPRIKSKRRSVGFLVTTKADNIHIEGFYMDSLWEGVSCGWGTSNITVLRNTIYNSGKRSIWFLGTENAFAAYNFIYMAGFDGVDFDAHNKNGDVFRNVMIGCGRWATFVEEGANNNYIVDQLCVMKLPNRSGWCMGFADNGTSQSASNNGTNKTHDNYFINCMSVEPQIFRDDIKAQKLADPDNKWGGSGNFFAKPGVGGKGDTFFWGNTELGCAHPTEGDNWVNAHWEDALPAAGRAKITELEERFRSATVAR